MAVGDQADILGRLKSLLPNGWFPPGQTPVLDTVLSGAATALAWAYGLVTWTGQQMRLATSQGGMLDLFAYDYFGKTLLRQDGETDAAYGARIAAALIAPRGTRAALIEAVTLLTGRPPTVFEPGRPADTGALNNGTFALGGGGLLGCFLIPYQLFVTCQRPKGVGIAYVMGLGGAGITSATGGLGQGLLGFVRAGTGGSLITDADIYAAIAAVMPAGTIAWVQITN